MPPTYLICQLCGLATPAVSDDAKNWLCSPALYNDDLYIVRCPQHISEWALRNCKAGRTKKMREKARWGREVWPRTWGELQPVQLPVPHRFQGAQADEDDAGASDSHRAGNGP